MKNNDLMYHGGISKKINDVRNIENTRYIRRFRIGNQHIFIQVFGSDMEEIREILKKGNQRIHIFDIYPDTISNIICTTAEELNKSSKLVIHIPRLFKDYKMILENKMKDISTNWKISLESEPVTFHFDKGTRDFVVGFTNTSKRTLKLSVYVEILQYTDVGKYFIGGGDSAVMTWPQAKNMELFKDTIIKNFKRSTPEGILQSFKDDNDIWDYLTNENDWKGDD